EKQALTGGRAAVAAFAGANPHPAMAVEVQLRPAQLGDAPAAALAEPAREAADGHVLIAEIAAVEAPVLAGLAITAEHAEHRVATDPVPADRQRWAESVVEVPVPAAQVVAGHVEPQAVGLRQAVQMPGHAL